MLRRIPLVSLLALTLLAACGDTEDDPLPPADAGGAADAGPTPEDAGAETPDSGAAVPDAGSEPADSGAPVDTGVPPDAGVVAELFVVTSTAGPIEAPERAWSWVPVPESRCMNDTPTGFGINPNPGSERLVIFLTGGNACFNTPSCFVTANADGYGVAKFDRERANLNGAGFDRQAAENLFRDWSYVYFPYCSGDVFSGTNPNGEVQGRMYTFVGYHNVAAFLARIVPTFPNVREIVLTGVSAGGFGAAINFEHVQAAFGPKVRVTLLDDSGPPMGEAFVPPCMQRHFRDLWGMDEGPLASCASCDRKDGVFMEPLMRELMSEYADRRFALISSAEDDVIRRFWGYGNNDCRDLLPTGLFIPDYTGARYRQGLEDLRDRIAEGRDNLRLYMPPGTRHVWSNTPSWQVTHHGVRLSDWVRQAVEDDPSWPNVP